MEQEEFKIFLIIVKFTWNNESILLREKQPNPSELPSVRYFRRDKKVQNS